MTSRTDSGQPIADTDAQLAEPAPRSRRSILFAAAGAVAGAVGSSLARPEAAAAANGQPVLLGQANSASASTRVSTTAGNGLEVESILAGTTAIRAAGSGIGGQFSAHGEGGRGVLATSFSTNGSGVAVDTAAHGATGICVRGISYGTGKTIGALFLGNSTVSIGVSGASAGGTGMVGKSVTTSGVEPAVPVKTGVYGYADNDSTALGVMGESKVGVGVKGKATSGSGVYGTSQTGYGVIAHSVGGTAAYFSTSAATIGTALHTVGRVKFDKSVGLATIAAGTKSVVVVPGIDVAASAAAVATLQGSAGGATVAYVAVDATNNRLTIYLTKNATVSVKVAWHLFG